jgi:serine/threonine protein kinase
MPGIEGLLAGRVLAGRYRIEEVIGRGGMGAVYRAADERLGREVAVKVITLATSPDAEARERLRARFLREARAAAALPHHPNVVPVYDYGTDAALGLDFLVMELLRGEDLASYFARAGAPPLPTAIWILQEASRGVAVGHRAGLVHRDVKPGNIFLARDPQHDEVQVRILDFGIAKLIQEEESQGQLTQDGRAPLSPAYASPEQLRGLSRITLASDVFSLGAIGYQLVTGERPFTDADRNRLSLGMPVEVPSPQRRNPAVPSALDEVVRRALAFEPADRFPDAGVLTSVIEQVRREMGEAPLAPYPPASITVLPRSATEPLPPSPPTGEAARDGTELLEDGTLLDPSLHSASPQSPAPGPSNRPPARRAAARRQRRGVGGWIVALLVALGRLAAGGVFAWWVAEGGRPARVTEAIPPPPESIPEIPLNQSVQEEQQPTAIDALTMNLEGQRYYRAGDYPTALGFFERAVAVSPENAEYRNNYALTLFRLGHTEEAAAELERVIRLDPNRAVAYANLGDVRTALGDTTGAIRAFEQFLRLSTNPRESDIAARRLRALQAPPPAPIDAAPADTGAVDTAAPPRRSADTLPQPVTATPTAPPPDTL